MEHDYNFLADLLTTYRSNPDWLKFFWLFIPAALVTLCGHGLVRWMRWALGGDGGDGGGGGERGERALATTGGLGDIGLYRIRTDENGLLYLEPVKDVPQITSQSEEDTLN